MSDPFALYEIFNYVECLVWIGVALGLPFFIKSSGFRQKLAVLAASLGFILFGISDYLEASMQAHLPLWLWAWKILCAAFILACRYHYIGWRQFRFNDRYFLFGLCCLVITLGIIWFQHYLYRD